MCILFVRETLRRVALLDGFKDFLLFQMLFKKIYSPLGGVLIYFFIALMEFSITAVPSAIRIWVQMGRKPPFSIIYSI